MLLKKTVLDIAAMTPPSPTLRFALDLYIRDGETEATTRLIWKPVPAFGSALLALPIYPARVNPPAWIRFPGAPDLGAVLFRSY